MSHMDFRTLGSGLGPAFSKDEQCITTSELVHIFYLLVLLLLILEVGLVMPLS